MKPRSLAELVRTGAGPEALIAALIEREGGYRDHPADRGGPTCWGITEQVARAHGYRGDMRELPRSFAEGIYRERYWTGPRFDQVATRSTVLAEELLDTGVNMGPQTATRFLQRALNVLNRRAHAYPDITVDGAIGRMTLFALDQFIARRGIEGIGVLIRAINGLQGCRYIEIAEADQSQEDFTYGWLLNRVV